MTTATDVSDGPRRAGARRRTRAGCAPLPGASAVLAGAHAALTGASTSERAVRGSG
ncbi:hypothetical protein ACH4U6_02255 [Streptomyces netropsis]|uniref:hypothetical protein n=1 Tax=Streptomyces netropsis TaxID=55404 RepID=UPI0037A94D97